MKNPTVLHHCDVREQRWFFSVLDRIMQRRVCSATMNLGARLRAVRWRKGSLYMFTLPAAAATDRQCCTLREGAGYLGKPKFRSGAFSVLTLRAVLTM